MKNYKLESIVQMKKPHPCGENKWKITRLGIDVKIECQKCGRSILIERMEFDKKLKKVVEE